jgi:hypothetical protein
MGRAMAQAVSRRPLTAEDRVRSRVGPCGICGGQSGTGIGVSPSTSVFPCQFHSITAPSSSQGCTISLQGCGVPEASAVGPFNNNKKTGSGYNPVVRFCEHEINHRFL